MSPPSKALGGRTATPSVSAFGRSTSPKFALLKGEETGGEGGQLGGRKRRRLLSGCCDQPGD